MWFKRCSSMPQQATCLCPALSAPWRCTDGLQHIVAEDAAVQVSALMMPGMHHATARLSEAILTGVSFEDQASSGTYRCICIHQELVCSMLVWRQSLQTAKHAQPRLQMQQVCPASLQEPDDGSTRCCKSMLPPCCCHDASIAQTYWLYDVRPSLQRSQP